MRRIGTMVAAALIGVTGIAVPVTAEPALAAPDIANAAPPIGIDLEIKTGDAEGKIGDKVGIDYQVTNHSKTAPARDAAVLDIHLPAGTQFISASGTSRCGIVAVTQLIRCIPSAQYQPGQSSGGTITVLIRDRITSVGQVKITLAGDPKPGNNTADLRIKFDLTAPTPSATTKSPTPRPSTTKSPSAAPTDETSDAAVPPATSLPTVDPPTLDQAQAVYQSGGLSLGFWLGILAIVAAVGLLGSLLYFRYKDRIEPDDEHAEF